MNEIPKLEFRGPVATISLRRPEQANRLTPDDLDALLDHLVLVNNTPEILILRFHATGKYFSSGYDISSLAGNVKDKGSLYFGSVIDAIEAARPITIAAVNGGVYGGATDLCLACDFRVGVPGSNMFMSAARLGLHIYPGAMQRYVSRLGINNAKKLFLAAQKIEADEMLQIGMLNEIVAAENLAARVEELTETLGAMAPIAVQGMKEALNQIAAGRFDVEAARQQVIRTEQSSDIKEGALAWKEKRKARFTGQ